MAIRATFQEASSRASRTQSTSVSWMRRRYRLSTSWLDAGVATVAPIFKEGSTLIIGNYCTDVDRPCRRRPLKSNLGSLRVAQGRGEFEGSGSHPAKQPVSLLQ